MSKKSVTGKVNSVQSMGTVDGPGVRYVVFLQGCNLRCKCCHNPDTWAINGGTVYTAEEIFQKALRFKEYFGNDGGITLTGGEPLLQADFAEAVFTLCKENGIHTCLDTSGSILNDNVKNLLKVTDRVLLDIKYTDDGLYKDNVGCSYHKVLDFLRYLSDSNIPTTLRQVIIPGFNDTKKSITELRALAENTPCVDKIELLPFKKLCSIKYSNMNMEFPFAHIPEPTPDSIAELEELISEYL